MSEALKIAQLQCRTQLTSQVLGVLTDPLWSTVLGFVAVHELRKREMVGPVADDLLYAGIIAVNVGRNPGLQDLAGKGIDTAGLLGAGALGVVAGKVGGTAASRAAAAGAGGGLVAAGKGAAGALIPVAGIAALAAGSTYAGLKLTNPKNSLWKRVLGMAIGGPITSIYRGVQGARGK
jgi:hypothetical protein